MGSVGSNRTLRLLAPGLLILHILVRIFLPDPNIFVDLYLYDVISCACILSVLRAPQLTDRICKISLALAIGSWTLGSTLSACQEFYHMPAGTTIAANALYLALYPLAFVGIPRALMTREPLGSIELLDAAILGLGLGSLGTAFLMRPALPHFAGNFSETFFAILFPVADLILLALTLSFVLTARRSLRSLYIVLGVSVFSASDLIFLWLRVNNHYSFGSITDDGWLIGLVLLAQAMWHRGSEEEKKISLHPLFIALSVLLSATLLSATSLRPGYLPGFIVIPTIATLILAFVRMTIALRQARAIGEERILARTDELTGLPNRRRFISELNALDQSPDIESALLLLDLDGFKPVNDKHGHEVGDLLLKEVSRRFTRALPHGSLLARLGGDEFGVILHGDPHSMFETALAIRATLSYPFTIAHEQISVGVSIGYVANDGAGDLLKRADNAMYHAKREGIGVWSEPQPV